MDEQATIADVVAQAALAELVNLADRIEELQQRVRVLEQARLAMADSLAILQRQVVALSYAKADA